MYGCKVPGSMSLAKQDWSHGRTEGSLKKQKKESKRRNKKLLNRKVRQNNKIDSRGGKSYYKRIAGSIEYSYVD